MGFCYVLVSYLGVIGATKATNYIIIIISFHYTMSYKLLLLLAPHAVFIIAVNNADTSVTNWPSLALYSHILYTPKQRKYRLTGNASPINSLVSFTNDVVNSKSALSIIFCNLSILLLDNNFCRFCGVSPPSSTAAPLTIVSRLSTVSWLRSSLRLSMRDGRSDSRPVDWGLRGPTGLGLGLARVREIGVARRRRCLRFILIFGFGFGFVLGGS